MSEEANEVNLKADKNENNIPDWAEFIATYLIATVCVGMALAGYIR